MSSIGFRMADYLGIDYGTKKIGLSWGNDLLNMAVPMDPVINFSSLKEAIEKISGIVKIKSVHALVIGYPLNMDDTKGKRTQEVEKFAEELKQCLGLKVYLVDERLTTFAAENSNRRPSLKNKNREKKGARDSLAAAYILQDFLDQNVKR